MISATPIPAWAQPNSSQCISIVMVRVGLTGTCTGLDSGLELLRHKAKLAGQVDLFVPVLKQSASLFSLKQPAGKN
jgi:hypothetical protein